VGKSDKKEKRVVGIELASLAWKAKGIHIEKKT
jgi:hypothetical protein